MDRVIVYEGENPLDTDFLDAEKNAMIALGMAMQAIVGTGTLVDGLACAPTGPASLQVLVAPGSIYAVENIDGTAYGSLDADTAHQIVKQGIVLDTTTLNCPAPSTTGFSINYLIQVAYQDQDTGSTVLPYYDSSNPDVAYSGPNNTGVSQNTRRQGACVLSVKAGTAATTGTQTTPAPDAGFTGLWVVTVNNGQTAITSGDIAKASSAPFIANKLTALAPLASPAMTGVPTVPTAAPGTNTTQAASTAFVQNAVGSAGSSTVNVQTFTTSGTYTPSAGMTACIVEMIGGGGGGGGATAGAEAASGGAEGGYLKALLTASQVGSSQAVTIGAKGTGGAAGANNGTAGGTTSLGSLLSCTGGALGVTGTNSGSAGQVARSAGGTPTVTTGMPILLKTGQSGENGGQSSTSVTISGKGGGGMLGTGGQGGNVFTSTSIAGENGQGYGSAGSGAAAGQSGTNVAGGDGTSGIVIVTEFIA